MKLTGYPAKVDIPLADNAHTTALFPGNKITVGVIQDDYREHHTPKKVIERRRVHRVRRSIDDVAFRLSDKNL